MKGLLIIGGLLGFLIVLIGWRFVHQLKRKKIMSSVIWTAQGVTVLAGFMIVLLVYSNLHSYQRLTHETIIADVYVRQLANQKYQLSLSFSDSDQDQHYYVLEGDQWQLDAKILKWKGWANLIGLDSFYQLERLSGRYRDIEQARLHLPAMHDLSQPPRGLDIWKMKRLFKEKLAFVDTLFGQGVFMPMVDGAHFQVSVGQSGLITRPVNDVAKAARL